MTENDTEKRYPVHHTDHENQLFGGMGAVYVTKAEFAAMKSERDALRLLVDEKQKLLDTATDKILAMDAERSELEHKLRLSEENVDRLTQKLKESSK